MLTTETTTAAVHKEQKVNLTHAKETSPISWRPIEILDMLIATCQHFRSVGVPSDLNQRKHPKKWKMACLTWSCLAVSCVVITMITGMCFPSLESKYTGGGCCCFYLQCWEELWKHLHLASAKCPWSSPSLGHHLGQFGPPCLWVIWQSQEFYGAMAWERGCDCRWVPFAHQTGWRSSFTVKQLMPKT